MVPYVPPNRWRPRHRYSWSSFKLAPVVVYYNTLDHEQDTQATAYRRGRIAEHLEATVHRANRGLQLVGAFTVGVALEAPPLPTVIALFAGIGYVGGAITSYFNAAEQTGQLIKRGEGYDFDDFYALQRLQADSSSIRPNAE